MPNLQWIDLDQIDVRPQVRRKMDPIALAELAEDIKARGLLQPIIVRPTANGRYCVIAGHRRRAACLLAGMPKIPTLVGDADQGSIIEMQLAENLQREDLDDADLGQTLADLYDIHASLDTLCLMVNKSKSWVSKKMKLARELEHMPFDVRKLWEDGITEDGEMLLDLQSLQHVAGYSACNDMCKAIRAGNAGREDVRGAIAKTKEMQARKPVAHAKAPAERKPRPRPVASLAQDFGAMTWNAKTALQIYNSWLDKERDAFNAACVDAWIEGARTALDHPGNFAALTKMAERYERTAFKLARMHGYVAADGEVFGISEHLEALNKYYEETKAA